MAPDAWLDVATFRCPHCGSFFADASWYAVEIGSDIDCGSCRRTFNPRKTLADRFLLRFELDAKGKVERVRLEPLKR